MLQRYPIRWEYELAALKKGRLSAPPMASAGPSFKTRIPKSERTQGESGGNAVGAAAGGCEGRKRRGRKTYRKLRCKKKKKQRWQKYQKLEECLTLEVGFLKVWWKEMLRKLELW